jgi:membrane protein implicated in regulation of membrane protease activity
MIHFIQSWWDALNFDLQIFYGIAIVALIFLTLQMIMTIFFGMDDASGGFDIAEHDSGMGIFSVRGVTAFLTGFGWTGVICTKRGIDLLPTVGIAFVVGFILMLAIYLMMRGFMRLQSDGTLDYSNAVGQVATVYLTISPVQRPGGQVEVMIQGRLTTAEALQKGSQPLAPGTKVKVVDKIGATTLIVEPLN